jgi:hypothetical protein
MAKEKVLYKTTYTIEVLTEENVNYDLSELSDVITDGEASGHELRTKTVKVVGKEAVKECEKHGTDTEFFNMDKEGNEIEDDYINNMNMTVNKLPDELPSWMKDLILNR